MHRSNDSVVIGKGVAELLGAKVGTELSILTEFNQIKQYTVVGIFNSESGIYNSDMILMNLNAARDFFNIPSDKVTDLMVYVNPADVNIKSTLVNDAARQISALANISSINKRCSS